MQGGKGHTRGRGGGQGGEVLRPGRVCWTMLCVAGWLAGSPLMMLTCVFSDLLQTPCILMRLCSYALIIFYLYNFSGVYFALPRMVR